MAKTKVSQWDSVAANNTDINTININEGCPPSTINNAIRETMAQIKNWQDGSSGDGWTSTGTITSNGTLTSNGITNITGSLYLDGGLGTNGQVLTSVGSTATPVWSSLGTMSAQNSNAVAITGGAVKTTGALNVTGSLTMDGATGSSGQFLTSGGSSATPTWTTITFPASFTTGMIILWSGSVASIPSGWALCNGANGTPNLRNKFVLGAYSDTVSAAYPNCPPNATGGYEDATLPSHTHTASSGNAGSHNHTYEIANVSATRGPASGFVPPTSLVGRTTTNTSSIGNHNHTVSVNSSGTSGTDKNIPPFYALAYIMKL
jgi:hypothetical protein